MERVEGALKTSFRKEMAVKVSPQVLDDFWPVNVTNGMSSDDFSVDELLDFSNENGFIEDEEKPCVVSVSHKQETLKEDKNNDRSPYLAVKEDFVSGPTSELCVPVSVLLSSFSLSSNN